jgi:WD40 repeat protein
MCLSTGRCDDDEGDYVITGSKDHYIKVFNVTDGKGGVVSPTVNLDPPHYDGIECLAVSGDYLFSASRDTCIKKWNLRTQELVRCQSHKNYFLFISFEEAE